MIDYRQFEGHTPKPWIPLRADVEEHDHKYKLWEPLEGDGKQVIEGTELSLWEATIPDALLIAAAPDLLAENKRLRAALSKCHNRAHNPQEVKQIVREALQEADNA